MAEKASKAPRSKPKALHYEQAIEQVESFYPTEIFGRGDGPLPKDLPPETINLIQAKAARMARMTCENILTQARLIAESDS